MGREISTWQALETFTRKHGTQRKAAKALGVSEAYLSDLLHGRRAFSARILDKLKLKRIVVNA